MAILVYDVNAQQKFCLESEVSLPLILVKNPGTSLSNLKINSWMSRNEIPINKADSPEPALFIEDQLLVGDCLLLDRREEAHYQIIKTENYYPWHSFISGKDKREIKEERNLIPVIVHRFKGAARQYGFISSELFLQLKESLVEESSTEEILKHPLPKNILMIYVVCDKEREATCELTIKKGNKWLKFPSGKSSISVMAKAKRETATIQKGSYRIAIKGDTPQGIYHLWASMFSQDAAYGLINRLDMGAIFPPLNAHSYEIYKPLMELLVPEKSLNDYWLQEWALAFNLGRNTIRLHDNTLDPERPGTYQPIGSDIKYRETHGCINTGRFMKEILSLLVKEGIFTHEELDNREQLEKLNWQISSKIGSAYILVKDKISNK